MVPLRLVYTYVQTNILERRSQMSASQLTRECEFGGKEKGQPSSSRRFAKGPDSLSEQESRT